MRGRSVYLAGPITGLTYAGCTDWRQMAKVELAFYGIDGFSPMRHKEDLHAESMVADCYENILLSSQRGLTERDRYDCTRCDMVIANMLGAQRVSIGTVIEMGWADANRIPIVLVMEEKGNLHDHAMVRELCPFRVTTVSEAVQTVRKVLLP